MSIKKALDSILEGNLDEMRQNFSASLSTKAVEKLEERKIEIAQQYFGQLQEEEQIDEISADLAARAAKIAKNKADDAGDKNYYAQQKAYDDQSERLWGKSSEKREAERKKKDIGGLSSGKKAKYQKRYGKLKEEQIDEKTIASKKSGKGTKHKVKVTDSDSEGSYVRLTQGKRVKDTGDYDRNAGAYFMGKGTYGSAKDILKTVKE